MTTVRVLRTISQQDSRSQVLVLTMASLDGGNLQPRKGWRHKKSQWRFFTINTLWWHAFLRHEHRSTQRISQHQHEQRFVWNNI